MDRTGPIAPGTVEQLVRWAKDDRFRGSIDVRGDHAASLYFSAGFIAHVDSGGGDPAPSSSDTKERVHAQLAERLAALLAFTDGSYVIRRSDELPPEARWLFGPMGLLDAARASTDRSEPSRWNDAAVQLDDTSISGPVSMGEDAFRIVVALGRTLRGGALQAELGWPVERFDRALDELARRGLLTPVDADPRQVARPGATPPSAAPVVDLRSGGVPDGPVRPTQPVTTAPALPSRPPAPAGRAPSTSADRPERPAPARPAARAASPADTTRGTELRAGVGAGAETAAPPSTTEAGGRTRASALRRLIQNLR